MYPEEIKEYILELYNRSADALVCGRAEIVGGAWQPLARNCHDNVNLWCDSNEGYEPVRGWLYFDLVGTMDRVMFVQHSVVRTPEGDLVDITPSNAGQDYPFIPATEIDDEFFAKEEFTENGNLYHIF